jgi:arylsulfatase A-like enzyme
VVRQVRRGALPVLLGLVALTVVSALEAVPRDEGSGSTGTQVEAAPTLLAAQPNIILITTDDQNRSDLRWMPKTRRLLGRHGVTFTSALSPDPLCCPARAELMTGQLGQNNGVQTNTGPQGGFHALLDRQNTLAAWLRSSGYDTAMVGKYLNGYARRNGPQTGWTIWNPSIGGEYTYTNTTFFNDGTPVAFKTNITPVISHYTVRYIHRFASSGRPFFIWASHLPPHGRSFDGVHWTPPLPTARHRDALRDVPAPTLSKPSLNRLGTRPWPYPDLAHTMTRAHVQREFTLRIESLLDVDDAVAKVVAALRDTGQLRNTYIFLVSDNANLMGEHAINGKNVLYREALEIPLVVRVPGTSHRRVSALPVVTTDITRTIVDLAGATAGRLQDGRSLAPALQGHAMRLRDTQLIQTGDAPGGWSFRGVWTWRYSYFHRLRDGASFLYDHRHDPYELHNVAISPGYHHVLAELQRRFAVLKACAGRSCNHTFGPVPRPR